MGTDPRTYITVHDGMPDHPKIVGLTDKAFRALVTGWCWCSRYLTDGIMPLEVWSRIGNAPCRTELVSHGLVLIRDTARSVEFHDYLEHQRSAEDVADLRQKRADAGSKGGKATASAKASAAAKAKQALKQNPSKPAAESEVTTTTKTTTALGESLEEAQVSNAHEIPSLENEPRSGPVKPIAARLTRIYTSKVGLSNFGHIATTIGLALASDYTEEQLAPALERLAVDRRPVTPDTLRIEIEGKPGALLTVNGVTRAHDGRPISGPGWQES